MNTSFSIFKALKHHQKEGKVKFILSGSASDYNITYKSNDDVTNQIAHAKKHWHHSFTAHDGDYVYFSAQSNQPDAEVHVKIIYQGKVFKESTVNGDFALALTGGCLS